VHHEAAVAYASHVRPIPANNYQLISDNTSFNYFACKDTKKDIIQTNNLAKNDKIQGNKSSKVDKIQRNNAENVI
jgi:hypothetical protein